MTIVTRPNDALQLRRGGELHPAAPSQVWDVEPAAGRGPALGVRTLSAPSRTAVRVRCGSPGPASGGGAAFEPGREGGGGRPGRREQRDNLALGAMMAAALLVGSVFGGAFSPAGTESAPQPPSAQGAAVHYAR